MNDVYEILKEYMIRPKGMFIWRDIPDWEGTHQLSNHGEVRAIWNRILSENDTQIVLVGIDKSRHSVSRYKMLKAYWKESERYNGEVRWKRLDHYGDYYISNYAAFKNCKALVLIPNDGKVTLIKHVDGKEVRLTTSVIKLFVNTFPEEIFIDHEKKEVNYVKKNDKSDSSIAFAS